jgi:hypothetical protein
MKFMHRLHPGFGQFRWVVLLLAVAVILPTAGLLWFMNKVVKSERLVVRQRLTTFYKGRLIEVAASVGAQWAEACRQLERKPSVHPYRQFVAAVGQGGYEGLLLYDDAGQRLYPLSRPLHRRRDPGAALGGFPRCLGDGIHQPAVRTSGGDVRGAGPDQR